MLSGFWIFPFFFLYFVSFIFHDLLVIDILNLTHFHFFYGEVNLLNMLLLQVFDYFSAKSLSSFPVFLSSNKA